MSYIYEFNLQDLVDSQIYLVHILFFMLVSFSYTHIYIHVHKQYELIKYPYLLLVTYVMTGSSMIQLLVIFS